MIKKFLLKMEKSGNGDNSRKYKFYRKPSIKKKGPEIRQTKTSAARMYMANPLLRYEHKKEEPQRNINIKTNRPNTGAVPKTKETNLAGNDTHNSNEPKRNINIKPNRPNTRTISNTIVTSLVGNGGNCPYMKPKTSSLSDTRVSGSDFIFNKNISSSTVLSPDFEDAFEEPKLCLQNKTKNENKTVNKEIKLPRKTLSSRHLENKKKEFNVIVRRNRCSNSNGGKRNPLRRSKSLETFRHDDCSTIQEETRNISVSFEILTNLESKITHVETKSPRPVIINDPCENFDDENKENVDFGIVDADSYEDLLIDQY